MNDVILLQGVEDGDGECLGERMEGEAEKMKKVALERGSKMTENVFPNGVANEKDSCLQCVDNCMKR